MQSPAAELVLSHVLCPRSINQIVREMIRNRHYHQGNPTAVVRVANGPRPSIGSVIDHLRKFSLMLLPPKKMLMRRTNVPIKNSTLVYPSTTNHPSSPYPLLLMLWRRDPLTHVNTQATISPSRSLDIRRTSSSQDSNSSHHHQSASQVMSYSPSLGDDGYTDTQFERDIRSLIDSHLKDRDSLDSQEQLIKRKYIA